jgi:copper chaperone CopZ
MSQPDERDYTVTGMSCGHCKAAVTEELVKVAGVRAVDVDLETGRVTVSGDGFADDDVRDAVSEAGYEVAA